MRRPAPASVSRRRSIAALLALAAGAAVTAVLVIAALLRTEVPHEPAYAQVIPESVASSSPEPAPSAPPVLPASPASPIGTRVLSATDGTTAWRSGGGACPGDAAVLEVTRDGGRTWESHDVGTATGSSGVLRLEASSEDLTYLVAGSAGDGCAPQYVATYTSGQEFEVFTDRTVSTWFVDPADPLVLHTSAGAKPAPCSAVAVAPRNAADAAVLCADSTVWRTSDAGSTWDGGIAVEGAVSIDDSGPGYVLGATGRADCAGVQVLALDPAAGAGPAVSGCLPSDAPVGEVAIAAVGDWVWLWAGDAVTVSAYGGRTW
ncbi:hypothetical protein [Naasia sp. SYSU D00948]|uniref:hypothetical protein n=1 Tax=Naasia sp. SYSU D00948 TaxID=2817379 RepID=UPI001B300A77|nr:hypothetical protein [Naasia sp. SYSU D00948]